MFSAETNLSKMKDIGIKGTLRVMLAGIAFLLGENAWSADTIHVATAGTLSSLMESAGRLVKLTGFINGTDVKFLRERINANKLTKLDLADVRIVSGGEAYNESYTTTNDVLGDYMFADCSKLTSITLPTTIVDIGRYAFSKTGITKVEIPDGVTHLGHASFADCGSLKTVVIGRRVSILNQAVFYNSSSITTVSVKPKTPPSLDLHGTAYDSRLFQCVGGIQGILLEPIWLDCRQVGKLLSRGNGLQRCRQQLGWKLLRGRCLHGVESRIQGDER